jgi:chaperonin GroES
MAYDLVEKIAYLSAYLLVAVLLRSDPLVEVYLPPARTARHAHAGLDVRAQSLHVGRSVLEGYDHGIAMVQPDTDSSTVHIPSPPRAAVQGPSGCYVLTMKIRRPHIRCKRKPNSRARACPSPRSADGTAACERTHGNIVLDRCPARYYIFRDTGKLQKPANMRDQEEEKMKIKPLGDRVLLKTEKEEEKTKGGLYIPETAQEKTQEGVVVAVGDDKDVITVKEGQKVMYDKYAGTNLKIDGEEHLIVKMDDIIAVVE